MIILVAGASHTGKTLLAQKLLKKYKYPYLSVDHLKMGLIRSGKCSLSPEDDDSVLTDYLWPIVREIIKTNIENSQNIIIEGCYIPFGWEKDFDKSYLEHIKYICLIFSREYIKNNADKIRKYENIIESRQSLSFDIEELQKTNEHNLKMCQKYKYDYILVDKSYDIDMKVKKDFF